jgi:hypothetical protein
MMALAFRKFDPYAFLQNEAGAGTPAKPARPAKVLAPHVSLSTFCSFSRGSEPICKSELPNTFSRADDIAVETQAALRGAVASPECAAEFPWEWSAGVGKLQAMPCPHHFKSSRWDLLIGDARRFIDEWASQCGALGWKTLEVFGVNPHAPDTRHDAKGLVILLGGHQLLGVEVDKAKVRSPSSGNILSIYRRRTPGQVAVWDLPE